ncbi:MAG: hypothetical protein ABIR57_11505 [Aeromicrobium sp.]
MTSILLTWNSTREGWDHEPSYEDMVGAIEEGDEPEMAWSVRSARYVELGEPVYLLRQGGDHRGLIGSGTVVGPPFEAKSWKNDDPSTTTYVPIRWDTMLVEEDVLPLDILRAKVPQQYWSPQSSGNRIKPEAEDPLARLWQSHVEKAVRGFCPACGSNQVTHVLIGLVPEPPDYPWIELAGCVVGDDMRNRRCESCGNRWNR